MHKDVDWDAEETYIFKLPLLMHIHVVVLHIITVKSNKYMCTYEH